MSYITQTYNCSVHIKVHREFKIGMKLKIERCTLGNKSKRQYKYIINHTKNIRAEDSNADYRKMHTTKRNTARKILHLMVIMVLVKKAITEIKL